MGIFKKIQIAECTCDSYKESQFDFHGIYCGKMCSFCFNQKYKQYDYEEEEAGFYEG